MLGWYRKVYWRATKQYYERVANGRFVTMTLTIREAPISD